MCTIAEGTFAAMQYVVGAIKGYGRHSSQCRSSENGEEALSLVSHTHSINSSEKCHEQSAKGRRGHPRNVLWSRDE